MTWDYDNEHGEDDVLKVAAELCGFNVADGNRWKASPN
jgi:formate dehydrogenase major subunit